MHKGIIAYVALIVIIIILIYIETGFKFFSSPATTTVQATTSTIPANVSSNTTTTSSTLFACSNYDLYEVDFNSVVVQRCLWTGGPIGVWVAAGNSGTEHLTIIGSNNQTYVNETESYSCVTFFKNVTMPEQVYTVTFATGAGGGSCGPAIVKFNQTLVPPNVTYDYVYNGKFSSGSYTGWTVTGQGFGAAPINFTHANMVGCYQGAPWSNYNGTQFAASTYHCGTSSSPGNITSSPFLVNKPFLNFKIISPAQQNIYIAILYDGNSSIIAHYNTYNTSFGGNPESTLRNASIPLTSLAGKTVRIRIVQQSTDPQGFITATDFTMATTPNQYQGVLSNLTIYNTT